MPIHSFLAFLFVGGSTATIRTKKQLPFEIIEGPLEGPLPLPRGNRLLGGPAVELEDVPLAFGAIPLGAVSMSMPEEVEEVRGPAVVDGPLRDLLDFGSALGAAVLRPGDIPMPAHHHGLGGAEGRFGGPLELPLDSLHVKMQDHVPAPLNIDEGHGKIRVFGTLPKNLTAKTLKVSLSGGDSRNLVVQYFLGQGESAKNLVGIEERFALDFSPADPPRVKYKAATGAFELLLIKPVVKPQNQIAIDFDATPSNTISKGTSVAKTIESSKDSTHVKLSRRAPPRRLHRAQASAKEFVHDAKLRRLHSSEVKDGLAKVTKELKQGASHANKDKTARVKEVASRAKQFVADAHLGDAQKELIKAFAPLDMGLVMLEMNHHIRTVQ